ncbi:hypothetical protein NHH82_01370 [Oxalobacteraceae bacterium OTU3REALA1]|nr:hypothetical protein NHH82_01370 [Oxalobacteraceae bacterium OTU3REALA1]
MRSLKYLGLVCVLALSACGGGSDHIASTPPPTPPVVTPPVSMLDSFFAAVMSLIGDGSETTTEPTATDPVAVTTPDDTEPATVK